MKDGRWHKTLTQLKHIYLMPFRAIAAAFRRFSRNRARIRDFVRRPGVAATLKIGMAITMALWLAIAFFSRDEPDTRLNDAVKGLWPGDPDAQSKRKPSLE